MDYGCNELVFYGIRLLAPEKLGSSRPMRAEHRWSSTNESGELWSVISSALKDAGGASWCRNIRRTIDYYYGDGEESYTHFLHFFMKLNQIGTLVLGMEGMLSVWLDALLLGVTLPENLLIINLIASLGNKNMFFLQLSRPFLLTTGLRGKRIGIRSHVVQNTFRKKLSRILPNISLLEETCALFPEINQKKYI